MAAGWKSKALTIIATAELHLPIGAVRQARGCRRVQPVKRLLRRIGPTRAAHPPPKWLSRIFTCRRFVRPLAVRRLIAVGRSRLRRATRCRRRFKAAAEIRGSVIRSGRRQHKRRRRLSAGSEAAIWRMPRRFRPPSAIWPSSTAAHSAPQIGKS